MPRLSIFPLLFTLTVLLVLSSPQFGTASTPVRLVVVYKSERLMQLVSADNCVLRRYRVALGRNPVGHKEVAGDCRTPEGRYVIDRRNGRSKFYKSLHISYPNGSDRAAAKRRGKAPGGEIEIHGLPEGFDELADTQYQLNWTKGCIALNNAQMDEIWQLVQDGTPIVIMP